MTTTVASSPDSQQLNALEPDGASSPDQPPQPSASAVAAWRRLEPVFTQIRDDAADRENTGELDHDAVAALRDAGFTTLRLPQSYGGAGLSFEEASWFLVALGKVESNLAQALRIHWITVEDLLSRPADDEHRERWLRRIAQGAVIGNALTEKNNVQGQTTTRLSADPTRTDAEGRNIRVLNGTKYYSTGAAYADWIRVTATDDVGEPVSLAVPADAPGVQIADDWDGFGQRLTASGTTTFTDTPVSAEEISPPGDGLDNGARVAFGQALAQYVHLATLVGIGEAVVADAANYVRRRTRGFSHGAAESPRQDPQVISKAVLTAANDMYEVGGASATSRRTVFDRHWRNARVLSSHNPLIYRARIIGDWEVNATPVERSYRVGTQAHSS